MHRIVMLATIVVFVSARTKMSKCSRIFRSDSLRCCTKLSPNIDATNVDLMECIDTPIKPMSCDREICIAKKKGYLSGTSSFDKDAVLAVMRSNGHEKELYELLKEKCVEADLREYGPPQSCDLLKLDHCMRIILLSVCPEWNDTGDCSGMKKLVEECTK